MLVRTYRLTDRLGVALLKSGAALGEFTLSGLHLLVAGGGGRWLGFAWAIFLRIGLVMAVILRPFLRYAPQAARRAGGSAGGAMARRAARAEMAAGLAEDPLHVQNRALSILTVGLLTALIAVILWATGPGRNNSTAVAIGVNPVLNTNPQIATPLVTAGAPQVALATTVPTATPVPAVLEVGGSLAYVVRERGQEDIWAVGVGARSPVRLTNSPEDDRDPSWAPDGRRLAYASRQDGNWELYLYDVATDNTSRMTFDLSFQGAPQWSPDGQWLVYESYQGNNLDVYILPIDGSQPPLRLTDHPAPDFSPVWSPDGRTLAFTSLRDGNADIYLFSLDDPRDAAAINLTNTPTRDEDHPAWSPDGSLLAFSALDEGLEKVFIKPANDPESDPQVLGRGRTPVWSPDGRSLLAAVDSVNSTHLVAGPFAETGVATEIIPVPLGSSDPSWTGVPLPPALVNSGGLPLAVAEELFVEQVTALNANPPYRLNSLPGVEAPNPVLNDRVNDSFNALRERTLAESGVDFLGQLEDAFWRIDRPPQLGEERRSWHMAGRAFAFNRNAIVSFPPPVEIIRQDLDVNTYWHVFVRVADEAQAGQLGEPLRQIPWDFASRNQGDVEAYDQGGRPRAEIPVGYYVDLTELALDYGWARVPAGSDWRANFNSTNYWQFQKRDGLTWLDAMRELYTEGQLGGFVPRATPIPAQSAGDAAGT